MLIKSMCCIGAFVSAATFISPSSSCVLAQHADDEPASPQSQLTPLQKEELRKKSNAEHLGVIVTGRVIQRFEMYSPHSEDALRDLKAMGFTQVILDWPNLHEAASEQGLKVVLANWWNQETKPEEIEKSLERARQVAPGTLIGFSVMDEPERNSPDTPFGFYIDLYEKLTPRFRSELPTTRLEISHWGPMAGWTEAHYEYFSFLYEAADVMRIMPYPDLNESPLDEVYFMMQRSRKLMTIAGRELPLVVILQTWILPPQNKLPEIVELKVMAMQAMLSGAETVSFFDYNPEVWNQTAGFSDQFKQLMNELTEFSERFRDHSFETVMSADGILRSTLMSPAGRRTRIEVNTQRQSVGAFQPLEVREFELPATSSCPAQFDVVVSHCRPNPEVVDRSCIQSPQVHCLLQPRRPESRVVTRCRTHRRAKMIRRQLREASRIGNGH